MERRGRGGRGQTRVAGTGAAKSEGLRYAAAFRAAPRLPSLPTVAPALIFPSPLPAG